MLEAFTFVEETMLMESGAAYETTKPYTTERGIPSTGTQPKRKIQLRKN